ncbi:hypothetical protein IHQ73_08165 [Bifidobacterium dentium]|uniref:hypothetical protein n=1 Tax=Bifidobacterium dentium TaxID=1689 RepID=UPI0018B09BC8|nr:hypothetical protein [Bifidobacterium dentium]MBF9667981.1 hypothetical protein [Bifidobacterium dentium]
MSRTSKNTVNSNVARRPYATMVTNFDSTEQRQAWKHLLDKAQNAENKLAAEQQRPVTVLPRIADVWVKNQTLHACESLLNADTSFVTRFAGVIRTACLYCPQIMLTVPEICDGLFFLSFGPEKINALLGKSYKDGPSIIISGQQESFEECLFRFMLTTVHAVREDTAKKEVVLDESAKRCTAAAEQYTIRPLEYCIFNRSVSHNESLSQPPEFYEKLTDRLGAWKNGKQRLSDVIAETFADFLHKPNDHFACLAQRWQEWIDAIAQGSVVYENQNAKEIRSRADSMRGPDFQGKDFDGIFKQHAEKNEVTLKEYFERECSSADSRKAIEALHTIAGMVKRSDAFAYIDAEFPEDSQETKELVRAQESGKLLPPFHTMLKDWYQFVYQRTLATHLGACLIAVSANPNSYEQIAGRYMADTLEEGSNAWDKALITIKRFFGAPPTTTLMLSGSITEILGGMPYHAFVCFCYQARTSISQWRECSPSTPARKQRLRTRNIAYLVQEASKESSLSEDAKSMGAKTLLAAVLAVLSIGSDQLWSNNTAPIWLVAVTAWFIAMVPEFLEFIDWLKGARSSSKTVVFMGD